MQDSFPYAESYDEAKRGYLCLRGGRIVSLPDIDPSWLLVKDDVARKEMDMDNERTDTPIVGSPTEKGPVLQDLNLVLYKHF
jgi:hypothetical protein